MCGRNSLFPDAPVVTERFEATFDPAVRYRPRYNIAPGAPLEVITNESPDIIEQFHWGLLPPWADDCDVGFVNAWAETAPETPSVCEAWERRPCLVLSSGFYEWCESSVGRKRPIRIFREDDPAFALAGLWNRATVGGAPVQSVAVLTAKNGRQEPTPDRMPVVLRSADERRWLCGGPEERRHICRSTPGPSLTSYEVHPRINNPAVDDARLVHPLGSARPYEPSPF